MPECPCSPYVNTVNDIAAEIISDLDGQADLSQSYLVAWLRNNIGALNNAIGSCFTLTDSLEFIPCIDNNQKDILKWMFNCHYYNLQGRRFIGASGWETNSWVSIEEGDSKIRRVSPNDIAKTYFNLAKDCKESLNSSILFYRTNGAMPQSLSSWNSPVWKALRVSDPHVPAPFPFYPNFIPPQ